MYAAFPRSEYLWASPTSTVASASLRMVLSVGLLGPHANQDGGGSPRFLTLPFPDVPCSKTPPQSPAIIANSDHLLLPSRYSTLSACGCRLTRLNRFTCVTACPSLCLRLAHVVTSISPRLDFRWGGSTPCRCGNLTRWKRQAWPGAPKYHRKVKYLEHAPSQYLKPQVSVLPHGQQRIGAVERRIRVIGLVVTSVSKVTIWKSRCFNRLHLRVGYNPLI